MARRVRNAVLDSRAARDRLKTRPEPHWCALTLGLHLGYRKRSAGGSWVARRRLDSGSYQEHGLGLADDHQEANGTTTLSFSQAQAAAWRWYNAGVGPANQGYTVADAMRDYMDDYEAEGKKAAGTTQAAIDAHILPKLGALAVVDLEYSTVKAWFRGLATAPPRVRARKGQTKFRKLLDNPDPKAKLEAKRKRKATANRLLTILKAALNFARAEGKVSCSDDAWARVKPFQKVDKPDVRYLSRDESLRLVNACPGAFRDLVRAALLTGARYGELTALCVADVNLDVGTVHIPETKGGKERHITLTDEGRRFFSGLVTGKTANARLLRREDGDTWGKSHQQRPLSAACSAASIKPVAKFHHLRHTHAAMLAMSGVPISVISKQLGHADERITSRHYAHLCPNYVSDTIRAHFPTLGIVPASNVARLKPKAQTSARHRRG